MATRNPSVEKKKPAAIEEDAQLPVHKIARTRITIPRTPKNVNEYKRAEVVSVYVEVEAKLGSNGFRFGTTANINDEDADQVKNRLYYEGLRFLEQKIKELASQDGPFSKR